MVWLRPRRIWAREPCELPDAAGHRRGAIWCCDVCGRRWILRYDSDRYPYWQERLLPWPRPPARARARFDKHPLIVRDAEVRS